MRKFLIQDFMTNRWRYLFLAWCCLAGGLLPAAGEKVSPHAYLYLDAYDARFECLVPAPQMTEILGKPPFSALTSHTQQDLLNSAGAAAQGWLQVKLDGAPAKLSPPTLSIVKGVPGRTERPSPDELLVASQVMVGFSWELELQNVPKTVEITWSGFGAAWASLPVTVVVGSQSESFELNAQATSHVWHNQGRLSLRSPLAEVPARPRPSQMKLPVASILWVVAGILFLSLRHISGGRVPGRAFMTWMTLIAGAVVLWPVLNVHFSLPHNENVPPDQAEKILRALLRNTYRAFDQRSESAIYDVLERSISGDLLQRVYLQTIQALTLDEQDKTRVRITDLSVEVTGTKPRKDGEGFIADVRWTALGTVGHWGHEHQRLNRYIAKVTIAPVPEKASANARDSDRDAWKMVDLEVLEEKRL
jgi:hypothetical protein